MRLSGIGEMDALLNRFASKDRAPAEFYATSPGHVQRAMGLKVRGPSMRSGSGARPSHRSPIAS